MKKIEKPNIRLHQLKQADIIYTSNPGGNPGDSVQSRLTFEHEEGEEW